MVDHLSNRDKIVKAVVQELFGPAPDGQELDTSKPIVFSEKEDAYGPFCEKGTGEEILQRDPPIKRYGVGVLYPFGSVTEEKVDGQDSVGLVTVNDPELEINEDDTIKEKRVKSVDEAYQAISNVVTDTNLGDFDLSLANAYKPSSMGISFLAEFPGGSKLVVQASGGRYRDLPVEIARSERKWWVRSTVSLQAEFSAEAIIAADRRKINTTSYTSTGAENLDLRVELYSRTYGSQPNQRLVTICLVNRTGDDLIDAILFQSHFKAAVISPDAKYHIFPYPRPTHEKLDEEEKSIELLYRGAPTYAVGHGCAADWDKDIKDGRVSFINAECLPVFETPSITPDIWDEKGERIRVPMAPLAGLVVGEDGLNALRSVVSSYESWIAKKRSETTNLEARYQEAAGRHLDDCTRCVERMKEGIQFLQTNPTALRAFQLANYAILLQQIHSRLEPRKIVYDEKSKRINFSQEYLEPDPLKTNSNRGYWRAFQIAFLLMSVASTADPDNTDRETVELIWFPTGGGKTEAYLGLAAFALFFRRLCNPADDGVHILMRYTLRLLTAQQFQRAARLICAMEYLRKKEEKNLGSKPYSIGMWVGGNNTPNTRSLAVSVLKGLSRGDRLFQNLFIVDRCPWCGAQMGPLDDEQTKKNKSISKVQGYVQEGTTVVFKCPDQRCTFRSGLPIYVIDEDIYEEPPSMVIGTVDKFAMLAWKSEARALFGLEKDGSRTKSPPGLIIQDELHLISGPLGSMVGLYETIIEELCTDRRSSKSIVPKIVSSTATIRRYRNQIKALYGRNSVSLFPPPGLEDGDSFFARHALDENGRLAPGRLYVGVHAPSLGSMQTVQVRTFTALLQAPMVLPEEERDPWWTLLLFFNSLRELGTTLSLLQSDIPDYQQVYMNRLPRLRKIWRSFMEIKELTGRASSEDVPKAISALERPYPAQNPKPVDVCLASNILEVGVDIDRLSLMSIVGQPKTTSQYIQVTGRVGRSWWERPGLIITIYSASKPRDRSHFEKFRSYHERLYAQVEPTSLTPFSPPALDRALHAVMVSFTLQTGEENAIQKPFPYPSKIINELKSILLPRVQALDPAEIENFEKVFEQRSKEWQNWQPIKWTSSRDDDEDIPLLRVAGAYATQEQKNQSWPTMQSMRSVDAACVTEITTPPTVVEGETRDAE